MKGHGGRRLPSVTPRHAWMPLLETRSHEQAGLHKPSSNRNIASSMMLLMMMLMDRL